VVFKWRFNLLGSMHSDAKTFIHRTHCGLSLPSTSVDVKSKSKKLSSYFRLLRFFTLLPLVDDVPSLFSLSQRLLLFLEGHTRKNTSKTSLYLITIFSWYENGHLQSLPQTVTKWFAPAPLDVASYDIELKMEIKLWKLRNNSRRLCEEVAAPKGAEAHTLGTTL
jgi:hypothetical protein